MLLSCACTFQAVLPDVTAEGDWYAAGYDDQGAQELMRLYQTIHTDHEVRLVLSQ